MSPRVTKELRPLLLPWALAAGAAVGHLVARPDSAYFHGALGDIITGLAEFAFFTGVLVLAAMPIGAELHERTLSLLFSQPIDRARLWKEKLFAASMMIFTLTLIHGIATAVMGQLSLFNALLYLAFIVVAISSVGYHTLATRSVLVGIASAAGTPYAITLSTYLIVRYLLGVELEMSDQAALTLILIACGAYSALSLWLSRRHFVSLELRDSLSSRAAEVPAVLVPKALSKLFCARPTGVVTNLIRKEVCLHKPIFLVSAIFTVAWFLTLLLMLVRPAWHDNCVATLNGLTGTQVVLMAILGGCTALGDDKALGTSMWHLTLPVSARRQWFIKLLSAFGTTLAVAVVLPTLLAVLTLVSARVGFLAASPDTLPGLAIPFLAVFILSFWSASIATNTVRAALTCVFTLIGIGAMVAAGVSLSETLFRDSPLQGNLVAWLLAYCQVRPDVLTQHEGTTIYPIVLVCFAFAFAALVQSLVLFRRGQTPASARIKYAIVLAALALLGSFWCYDLTTSLRISQRRFDSEVTRALTALPRDQSRKPNQNRTVTLEELFGTDQLSSATRVWLRNSKITVTSSGPIPRSPLKAMLMVIEFPDSGAYALSYLE